MQFKTQIDFFKEGFLLFFNFFKKKLVYLILQKCLTYKFTILNIKYKRVKQFKKLKINCKMIPLKI